MKYVLRPAVCVVVASAAILIAACDHKSPSNDGDQGGSSPIILHGGERLGWDQAALSGTNPSSYTYIMYVDGAPTTLSSVSCSGTAAAGYTCSSLLPRMSAGVHNLSLVASVSGSMSAPSRSLSVSVSLGTTVPDESIRQEKGLAQPRCSEGATSPCYRSAELLRSPGVISTPVSAPNGRVLFVVDGRQIQSVSAASTAP